MSEAEPAGPGPEVYRLYQEGLARLADGDPTGAIAPLERAVELAPSSASLREALGRACLVTSRIRRATEEFAEALALEPSNDYAHYGLARAYERQGELHRAARHYKLASALSPRPSYRRAADRVARRTEGE